MKIYCAHATSFDFQKDLYEPLSNLKGHEFIFPHRTEIQNSKETIRTCDLVLAEVSYPSIGMGIELGWADAFNIPILAVHQAKSIPSQSIRLLTKRILSYTTIDDLMSVLTKELS